VSQAAGDVQWRLTPPVPGIHRGTPFQEEPDRARVWIIARAVQEGVAIMSGRVDASGSFDEFPQFRHRIGCGDAKDPTAVGGILS